MQNECLCFDCVVWLVGYVVVWCGWMVVFSYVICGTVCGCMVDYVVMWLFDCMFGKLDSWIIVWFRKGGKRKVGGRLV